MTMKIGILLIVLCSCKLQRCSHDTLTFIAGGQKKDKRADTYFIDFALNQFDRLFLNLGETKIVQPRNRRWWNGFFKPSKLWYFELMFTLNRLN